MEIKGGLELGADVKTESSMGIGICCAVVMSKSRGMRGSGNVSL